MDWLKLAQLVLPVVTYVIAYFVHRAPPAPPTVP